MDIRDAVRAVRDWEDAANGTSYDEEHEAAAQMAAVLRAFIAEEYALRPPIGIQVGNGNNQVNNWGR